jgi:alcohol dehydrogenase
MKALLFDQFRQVPQIRSVPDPEPPPDGVVVEVRATGLCRSDWHGWMGHDADIRLPHVPGHEFAGLVVAKGQQVRRWRVGDRVTVPFVLACGRCPECQSGNQQVCEDQLQPGFTLWGSFAQFVSIPRADMNLVSLPEGLSFSAAASLGCRFATAFRALVDQGRISPGEWLAIHGCGGVGLSAVMIASAMGANIIAVDISNRALELAKSLGAHVLMNAREVANIPAAIRDMTRGGAHISIDAFGHRQTCHNAIASLRRRGRHVQVGLLLGDQSEPAIPMSMVIAKELELLGSHGMQAHRYPAMLALLESGKIDPTRLVGQTIGLKDAGPALAGMDRFEQHGATVITEF